ncbi:MAG: hypothetical protein HYU52_11040 [Acidobacteria bacterium]|nr:hypothetical protein [Acidobacteriota bacterium]
MRSLALVVLLALPALTLRAAPVPIAPFNLGPAAGNQQGPAIAEGRDGFLSTWIDTRKGNEGDLRAARLDGEGNVLDAAGLLIEGNDDDASFYITSHRVFWTGTRWLVLYLKGNALKMARLDPDGTIEQAPITVASGADVPMNTFEAIVIGERVVVTGPAPNGASMIVLDLVGELVTGPIIVERTTAQRPIRAVLPARLTNDVVIVELAAYACSSCPTAIIHRMSLGGFEIARATLSGIDDEPRVYAFASTSAGYLLVGQDYGAQVDGWLLGSGLATVASHQVISSKSKFGFVGSLFLRGSPDHSELFYFAPLEEQGVPVLYRAPIAANGNAAGTPFDLGDATAGQLDIAFGSARTIAVMTRRTSTFETDIVARTATSVDSLPMVESRDLTMTAPVQRGARAVRNEGTTLVSWVERPPGATSDDLFATRLDAEGRPILAQPPRLIESATSYSIAGNGVDYLVARTTGSSITVRRLGWDLAWRDESWTTLVESGCGELGEHSLVWDGQAWWLGWLTCGNYPIIQMRRFGRELDALTPVVSIQATEPHAPMLAPVNGSIIVLWNGAPPDCNILCPPALGKLRGARVSYSGVILTPPKEIIDDVELGLFDLASRGSEILAIWGSAGEVHATRITKELVALDVGNDSGILRGELLEDSGLDQIDMRWDGTNWVVAAQTIQYSSQPQRTITFRRFAPGDDLHALWNDATIRDLGEPAPGFALAVSAAAGGATHVIQPLANESTTGVFRYFSRNMSDPPRTRGVRR